MKTLLFLLTIALIASADLAPLPSRFSVVERFLSLPSIFDVSADQGPFVVARKRFFSSTTTFDLEDAHQKRIATASSRFFSWGILADVLDPEGKKIGSIEEELFRLLPWAEYKVFNHENQLVAIAKMNFWGTEFELSSPSDANQIYATIRRPFLRCYRDDWTVQIKNDQIFEQQIDPRLLVILAIYQTDKDDRDRFRRELIDQLTKDHEYYEGRRFH